MSTQDEVRLSQLQAQIQKMQTKMSQYIQKKKITPGTNAMVTWDENGMIVSARALESVDIPLLPITKIKGLEEMLSRINEIRQMESPVKEVPVEDPRVSMLEKQIQKLKIDVASIPRKSPLEDIRFTDMERSVNKITDRVNQLTQSFLAEEQKNMALQQRVGELSSQYEQLLLTVTEQKKQIGELKSQIAHKADAVQVEPGVYTKMSVNREGVITGWEPLTLDDLPRLSVKDIVDLQLQLNAKADQSFTTNLANTVASLTAQISRFTPTDQIMRELKDKVSTEDIEFMSQRIATLMTTIRNYQENVDKKLHALMQEDKIASMRTTPVPGRPV